MAKLTDIVVAVHGMGQQLRFSTVRYVTSRLAASSATGNNHTVTQQPLGYFHTEVKQSASVVLADDAEYLSPRLSGVGFAEVFWANIPERVLKEGNMLEETKAWGRTVVARAQAMCARGGLNGPDFGLASEVIDEIIETIYVIDNLLYLFGKAGIVRFDLREVLEAYLGDVQIVAEFASFRREITQQFHEAMESIYREQCEAGNPDVRLHVVAHSEGSVVSFLALMEAMSGLQVAEDPKTGTRSCQRTGELPPWLRQVRGYMTLGSPIDKHLLLWPGMWAAIKPLDAANEAFKAYPIRWRNYYDFGDPVGFKLETAREFLAQKWSLSAFEFSDEHDYGFSRYLLPGKAHVDYWDDAEIFDHFVNEVAIGGGPPSPKQKPPRSKPLTSILSPTLPYLFSILLLLAGVYVLKGAVLDFIYPYADPQEQFVLQSQIGLQPTMSLEFYDVLRNTVGITGLIIGITLLARIPRLAAGLTGWSFGVLGFIAGSAIYLVAPTESEHLRIGVLFGSERTPATLGVIFVALLVALLAAYASARRAAPEKRRQRWLGKGMRPLIYGGGLAVALIVVSITHPALYENWLFIRFNLFEEFRARSALDDDTIERLREAALLALPDGTAEAQAALASEWEGIIRSASLDGVELDRLLADDNLGNLRNLRTVRALLVQRPALWPVVLAGAMFLYLWWLAAMLFDLAFVWHRYIRRDVAYRRLSLWRSAVPPRSQISS